MEGKSPHDKRNLKKEEMAKLDSRGQGEDRAPTPHSGDWSVGDFAENIRS